MQSTYDPPRQMFFYLDPDRASNYADIRIHPGIGVDQALRTIGKIYTQFDPVNRFVYHFADQPYGKKFENEQRIGSLAGFFTALPNPVHSIRTE